MTHIRMFLAVEAFAFAAAAQVHRGYILSGYRHHQAAIAESVIAGVLMLGLAVCLTQPRLARRAGLAAQGFALVGTFVGLFTIAIGVGPQSAFDLILHAAFVLLLAAGLVHVKRSHGDVDPRRPQSTY